MPRGIVPVIKAQTIERHNVRFRVRGGREREEMVRSAATETECAQICIPIPTCRSAKVEGGRSVLDVRVICLAQRARKGLLLLLLLLLPSHTPVHLFPCRRRSRACVSSSTFKHVAHQCTYPVFPAYPDASWQLSVAGPCFSRAGLFFCCSFHSHTFAGPFGGRAYLKVVFGHRQASRRGNGHTHFLVRQLQRKSSASTGWEGWFTILFTFLLPH